MTVAVLFARQDSIYKKISGCDVYDIDRDARSWDGGAPVVAHPPCRSWGRLRMVAKPREGERDLAVFAVAAVRRWGGVLEHPATSTLWAHQGLPLPGAGRDSWGGFTIPILQHWFGHRAEKATWLYVCGIEPQDVPAMHFVLGGSTHVIAQNRTLRDGSRMKKGHPKWRPEVSKAEREHTPEKLAHWLVELARLTKPEGERK